MEPFHDVMDFQWRCSDAVEAHDQCTPEACECGNSRRSHGMLSGWGLWWLRWRLRFQRLCLNFTATAVQLVNNLNSFYLGDFGDKQWERVNPAVEPSFNGLGNRTFELSKAAHGSMG